MRKLEISKKCLKSSFVYDNLEEELIYDKSRKNAWSNGKVVWNGMTFSTKVTSYHLELKR